MSCKSLSPHPVQSAWSDDDEREVPTPCAEALMAATLALMTGVVERAALLQPLAGHGQSLLMAAKVRSNLSFLAGHPQLSEGFRLTLGRLRTHWDRLTAPAPVDEPSAEPERAEAAQCLWHRAPAQLQ